MNKPSVGSKKLCFLFSPYFYGIFLESRSFHQKKKILNSGKIFKKFTVVSMHLSKIIESEGIDFIKRGKHLIALCPFHEEKSPSFFVDDQKDIYHCFGCGASGNLFSFIKNIQKKKSSRDSSLLEISNALKYRYSNLEIKNLNQFGYKRKNFSMASMYDLYLLEIGTRYYNLMLNYVKDATILLQLRGVSSTSAEVYSLGYSSNKKNGLFLHFLLLKIPPKKLVRSGMIFYKKKKFTMARENERKKEKWNNYYYYDMFRGRLIIPIKNSNGIITGFGGRLILKSKFPKYINSRDYPLFKKKRILFSENLANMYLLLKPRITIIVEGYLDAISLFQNGIRFAVASLGTNLDFMQIEKSKKLCINEHVILCFDSDSAGENANLNVLLKYIDSIQIEKIRVSIAKFPSYDNENDPDEYCYFKGANMFVEQILNTSLPFLAWLEAFLFLDFSESVAFLEYLILYIDSLIENLSIGPFKEKMYERLFKKLMFFDFNKQTIFILEFKKILEKRQHTVLSRKKDRTSYKGGFSGNQLTSDLYHKYPLNSKIKKIDFQSRLLFFLLFFPKMKEEIVNVLFSNELWYLKFSVFLNQQSVMISSKEIKKYHNNKFLKKKLGFGADLTFDKETFQYLIEIVFPPEDLLFLDLKTSRELILLPSVMNFFLSLLFEKKNNMTDRIRKSVFILKKLENARKIYRKETFFYKASIGEIIQKRHTVTHFIQKCTEVLRSSKNESFEKF